MACKIPTNCWGKKYVEYMSLDEHCARCLSKSKWIICSWKSEVSKSTECSMRPFSDIVCLSFFSQGEFSFQDHTWKTISSSAKDLISSLLSVEPYKRPTASDVCLMLPPPLHIGKFEWHTTLLNSRTMYHFEPASAAPLGDRRLRKARSHGCRGRLKTAEVQC